MSPSKLVAVIFNSFMEYPWSLEVERTLANDLDCEFIDYGNIRSVLDELRSATVDEAKLNKAAYEVFRSLAKAPLSLGRSIFMVSLIEPDEFRAHVDGLVALADAYSVPLTIIENKWNGDESVVDVDLNDIPHLILPGDDWKVGHDKRAPAAIRYNYLIQTFVRYFGSMPELVIKGGNGIPVSAWFRHFSHRHPLLLNKGDEGNVEKPDHCCVVCTTSITGQPYYSCLRCGFFLHKQCAELPQNMKSPIHSHPLRLVMASWEKSGSRLFNYVNYSGRKPEFKIKCLVCDSEERLPFYGCPNCHDLFVHNECIRSIQLVFKHPVHPHPLTMDTMNTNLSGHDYRCYACGGEGNIISYCCRKCDFDFHLKCPSSLPPYVHHRCHKDHPLYLSMPPKDETNEYYCEVCAERRHPDYWIYFCKRCEYEAHPHCVVEGISSYIYNEEKEADDNVDGDLKDDPEEGSNKSLAV